MSRDQTLADTNIPDGLYNLRQLPSGAVELTKAAPAIEFEQTRPGFAKFHLNKDGAQPWGWHPVFHVLTEPDPHRSFHEHMSQPMWVTIVRGDGYLEHIKGRGLVTRVLGDRWLIDYEHRIVELHSPEVWTLAEYVYLPHQR